ncbi:ribbon-helix-helix domain-containing protein [candidate division KSB1 bacterium]|nr:ribbon-helix-helix domain-containing protein [candidate division KSB1 bacterium]
MRKSKVEKQTGHTKLVSVTVRVDPTTVSRIKGAAYELRIPLSRLVEQALVFWLETSEGLRGKPFVKREKLASGRPLDMSKPERN